jgi:hypothetical protein
VNFAILPVTKWFTWNETAPTATALFLSVIDVRVGHIVRVGPHVCVSGLQIFNPVSKSCFSTCSDSHGLVPKPPTRNAYCPGGSGIELKKPQEYEPN